MSLIPAVSVPDSAWGDRARGTGSTVSEHLVLSEGDATGSNLRDAILRPQFFSLFSRAGQVPEKSPPKISRWETGVGQPHTFREPRKGR